jgi:excisionase family DNA binding protein
MDDVLEMLPGFSQRYLYYLVASKQIPHIKPTKRKVLFDPDDLQKWLGSRKIGVED